MFRTTVNDVSLFGGRTAAGPKPSFRPAVEALEERVVPSSLNGLYLLTVAVAGQPAPVTTEFRVNHGVFALNLDLGIQDTTIFLDGRVTLVEGTPHLVGDFSVSNQLFTIPLTGRWGFFKGSFHVNGEDVGTGILTASHLEVNASFPGVSRLVVRWELKLHGVPSASGTFNASGLGSQASGSWTVVRIAA